MKQVPVSEWSDEAVYVALAQAYDTDGSIGKKSFHLKFTNIDRGVIDAHVQLLARVGCQVQFPRFYTRTGSHLGKRPVADVIVPSSKAVRVLSRILPYMSHSEKIDKGRHMMQELEKREKKRQQRYKAKQQVSSMMGAGKNLCQIATATGLSRTCVLHHAKCLGYTRHGRKNNPTWKRAFPKDIVEVDKILQFHDMALRGKKAKEIARTAGVPPDQVYRRLYSVGMLFQGNGRTGQWVTCDPSRAIELVQHRRNLQETL